MYVCVVCGVIILCDRFIFIQYYILEFVIQYYFYTPFFLDYDRIILLWRFVGGVLVVIF